MSQISQWMGIASQKVLLKCYNDNSKRIGEKTTNKIISCRLISSQNEEKSQCEQTDTATKASEPNILMDDRQSLWFAKCYFWYKMFIS